MYIYSFLLRFSSHIGYYIVLIKFPVLYSRSLFPIYFYIVVCIYQSQPPNLSFLPHILPLLKISLFWGSFHHGSAETNLTTIHEDTVSIPGLTKWVKDPMLLWAVVQVEDAAWIWHRLATSAPIWPLAWEPSYVTGWFLILCYLGSENNAWNNLYFLNLLMIV